MHHIKRPDSLRGESVKKRTACGPIFVTIDDGENGLPFEIFLVMGKAGDCASSQMAALGRLLSWGLQNGGHLHDVAKQLRGITCHDAPKGSKHSCCSDAIAMAIVDYLQKKQFPCAESFLHDEHNEESDQ